jgi:hypothetical protein
MHSTIQREPSAAPLGVRFASSVISRMPVGRYLTLNHIFQTEAGAPFDCIAARAGRLSVFDQIF